MKFTFHVGVNVRAYGNVEITAESIEAAVALLTADFISDNIEPGETTWDSPQDIAIIDVKDEAGVEFSDYEQTDVSSPYDMRTVAEAGAALPADAASTKVLLDALEKVAALGPVEKPEEEDYTDTEEAYANGIEVAGWEVGEIARDALRSIGLLPPFVPGSDSAATIPCPDCAKKFVAEASMNQHRRDAHGKVGA